MYNGERVHFEDMPLIELFIMPPYPSEDDEAALDEWWDLYQDHAPHVLFSDGGYVTTRHWQPFSWRDTIKVLFQTRTWMRGYWKHEIDKGVQD